MLKRYRIYFLSAVMICLSTLIVTTYLHINKNNQLMDASIIEDKYKKFIPHELSTLIFQKNISELTSEDMHISELALMFADMRDYTSLSEELNLIQLSDFSRALFNAMQPAILKNNGIVYQYLGDAIVGVFKSPDNALQAALDIKSAMRNFNVSHCTTNKVKVGIGVHYGPVALACIGDQTKMNLSIHGDAINLASRIEGLTKYYDTAILVSGNVYHNLNKYNAYLRFIDIVQVKGRKQSTELYQVLDIYQSNDYRDSQEKFSTALNYYKNAYFSQAKALFSETLQANPFDSISKLYIT